MPIQPYSGLFLGFWARFLGFLAKIWANSALFGPIFEPILGLLGPVLGVLCQFRPILGVLGTILGYLGLFFRAFGQDLGQFSPIWAYFWGSGPDLVVFEPILGLLRPILGGPDRDSWRF